ncbi:phosphopantetheine-binding protein [Kribbella sp. NPDC051587]|uniref:phosphopantetheine-binding protein n=1 Tax=Kribbella sp. NPDC051587 TaxID=3364119 RepID=UPI00378BDEA3
MTSEIELSKVKDRIIEIVEEVLGFEVPSDQDALEQVDSLHLLEILVTLEEEFGIDTDQLIDMTDGWWTSMDRLVAFIAASRPGPAVSHTNE